MFPGYPGTFDSSFTIQNKIFPDYSKKLRKRVLYVTGEIVSPKHSPGSTGAKMFWIDPYCLYRYMYVNQTLWLTRFHPGD